MHGILPLFDSPMILFYEIVEKVIGLVKNIITRCFADGAWVGVMPVRYDPLWSMNPSFQAFA